ncbi:MAG: hypothetical protein GAK29_02252 [Acinetobacter bereziniae]|uniref:D-alanyl-D-alanine carboxypeptidase n=1 Tax=Acinetobacter bereziniae TaxID=106648 RepID=A0A833UP14_ACIBZ|nr:MAG: hypothetical protein GAK29_02252 [Acinetobacter bereziniae]
MPIHGDEVAIKDKQLIAEPPVIKSTLKMFKVEARKPQLVTTSLYNDVNPIDLNTFDVVNSRVMKTDNNGLLTAVEPLTTTQTRLNVQLNETSLTAPLEKIMHLAKVNVYQDNQLIQSFDIEDEVHIEQASWFERLLEWIKSIFGI